MQTYKTDEHGSWLATCSCNCAPDVMGAEKKLYKLKPVQRVVVQWIAGVSTPIHSAVF